MNFISGVTMSAEEAQREAQDKDAAKAAAAASEQAERVGSWGSRHRSTSTSIPPIPNYRPPSPPSMLSGQKSPEQEITLQRAERQAHKTESQGIREEDVPDRTLKTTSAPPDLAVPSVSKRPPPPNSQHMERRESAILGSATILPVVEEDAEAGSTGGRSRSSHLSNATAESDGRPLTPAKDGDMRQAGFGNPLFGNGRGPPPTPPKTAYGIGSALKPDSADSGYGVTGVGPAGHVKSSSGSQKSLKPRSSISRESLDKALPPLPRREAIHQDVS